MPSNAARRPLPALLSLLALLVLAALVWWRVINRDSGTTTASHRQPCTSSSSTTPAAKPTVTLPAPSAVRVLVLNSTDRTGIAAKARTALIADGFASPSQAANFEGKGHIGGVGEIRYAAAQKSAAVLLGYYLPGAKLVQITRRSATVTVVLGPRYSAIRSAAAARAALAAARATSSPSAPATGASTGTADGSPSPSPSC